MSVISIVFSVHRVELESYHFGNGNIQWLMIWTRQLHDRVCHTEEQALVNSNHSSAQSPPTGGEDGDGSDVLWLSQAHINTINGIHSQECLLSSKNLDVTQTTAKITSSLLNLQHNNLWTRKKYTHSLLHRSSIDNQTLNQVAIQDMDHHLQ